MRSWPSPNPESDHTPGRPKTKRLRRVLRKPSGKRGWLQLIAIVGVGIGVWILLALISLFVVNYTLLPLYTGGKVTHVPHIEGLPLPEALDSLRALGLTPDTATSRYSKLPEGFVVEAIPTPGMKVKVGRKVKLVVSKGEHLIEVPDVIGMDFELGTRILEQEGLVIGSTEYTFSDEIGRNRILSVTPPPGTQVRPGDTVRIAISLGPLDLEIY